MANYYWLKLHYDILDDWKVGTLPDSLKWLFIQCLCVAGEIQDNGFLPEINQFAYRIRKEPSPLASDLSRLAANQLVELRLDADGNERWFIPNYEKRQSNISDAQRKRDQRERERIERMNTENVTDMSQASHEHVTARDTDKIRRDKIRRDKNTLAAPAAAYAEILQMWQSEFPNKPQPRANNKTLQGKMKTRCKSAHFKENWKRALVKAGGSQFLRAGDWFSLGWFLKNDDNYEKCLNGNYDDKQASTNSNGKPKYKPVIGGI